MRLLVLGLLLCNAAQALAQRRDGGAPSSSLEVSFATPVRFGEVTVPPGRYRLSLGDKTIALSNAATMVFVTTLTAETTTSTQSVTPATATLHEKADDVTLTVKNFTEVLTARGKKAAVKASGDVQLASKQEVALAGGIPQTASERELVAGALGRYEKDVLPCADQAHKNRWSTDDPRFVKCVCPFADKWRLPKVQAALRVHRVLAKGKSGFSVTVTPAGKAESCRVWVGPRSPEEVAVTPAPSPATPQ